MTKGKTLDEFRTMYDRDANAKKRIDAGLIELGESWEYIGEFLKRIGFATSQWGKYRTSYLDHLVEAPRMDRHGGIKIVIAGTKRFAAKLRTQPTG